MLNEQKNPEFCKSYTADGCANIPMHRKHYSAQDNTEVILEL